MFSGIINWFLTDDKEEFRCYRQDIGDTMVWLSHFSWIKIGMYLYVLLVTKFS